MSIRFEGLTATIADITSPRARRWAAGVALGLATCCAPAVWLSSGWVFWAGIAGLFLSASIAIIAVAPDRRIIFDTGSREIRIARRYPWQGSESENVLPFSAVYSIGVNRMNDEDGDAYSAVLRLNGGRNIALWGLRTRETGRWLRRFVDTEPDLETLQRLTGFRREDRLD